MPIDVRHEIVGDIFLTILLDRYGVHLPLPHTLASSPRHCSASGYTSAQEMSGWSLDRLQEHQ